MPGHALSRPGCEGQKVHMIQEWHKESGLMRTTESGAVSAASLAALRPAIGEAIRTGERVALCESGWWLRVRVQDLDPGGAAIAGELWRVSPGPRGVAAPEGAAHVAFVVFRDVSGRPFLEISRAGLERLPEWLGVLAGVEVNDLARLVAWVWLQRPRPA